MAYTTDPGLSNVLNTGHGLRDELADTISIVSPTDVPLLSKLNRIPVGNTYFEWMMDTISKPSATSTTAEGAEADFDPPSTRLRAAARACIVRKTVEVSDTMRALNYAGVEDDYTYNVWKQSIEWAKQMEYNLHWGVGASSGATRQTTGLIPWILFTGTGLGTPTITGVSWSGYPRSAVKYRSVADVTLITQTTNVITTQLNHGLSVGDTVIVYQGTLDGTTTGYGTTGTVTSVGSVTTFVSSAVACTATTTTGTGWITGPDWTRGDVNQVFSAAWDSGMNVDGCLALCGALQKRIISQQVLVYSGTGSTQSMNLLNNRISNASENALYDTIDIYNGDFGKVFVNLDRYMNATAPTSNAVLAGHTEIDISATSDESEPGIDMSYHPTRSIVFIEPSMFEIGVVREMAYTDLAKTADSSKGMIVGEMGLKCKNPSATAGIFGFGAVQT